MPNIYPLQDDFSSGEISPRLRGKTRSKEYRNGLAFCENFEVTPQGSLEMRGGTQHIATIPDAEAYLHTFPQALGEDVCVVIGTDNVSLYNLNGQINGRDYGNLVRDPLFYNGLSDWDVNKSNIYGESRGAEVTPISGSGVSLSITRLPNDPKTTLYVQQTFTVPTIGVSYRAVMDITFQQSDDTSQTRFGRVRLDARDDAGNVWIFYDELFNQSNPPPAIGTKISLLVDSIAAGTKVTFQFYLSDALSGNSFKYKVSNISFTDINVVPSPVSFPTPANWDISQVHTAADSADRTMIFTVAGGDMYRLDYDQVVDIWTFVQFTPDFGVTPDPLQPWPAPYPSTCTFHQGRLWLANSVDEPSTIWASATGRYNDFYVGDPSVADEPLIFTLATNGEIQWLDGLKLLLIGTDRGEVIGQSSGPVITGSDFDFSNQQTWGSTNIQTRQVSNKVLFITTDRKRLRTLYDGGDITNSYESADLTITADNLLATDIVDLIFAQSPDYQVGLLLKGGQIAMATEYPPKNMTAWYRYQTEGQIQSVTETNEITGTSLWQTVRRSNDEGEQKLYLELKIAGNVAQYNLDNYIVAPVDITGVVTGLDHLNGYTVSIVLLSSEGRAIHTRMLVLGGVVQLEDWAVAIGIDTALVGLRYVATAVTLPIEGSQEGGTAQVQKRRFSELFLRLNESGIPKINGKRPPVRTPAARMNLSEPLFTGDVSLHLNGWNEGVITIEQDLPLATQISAIFGKVKGSAV